MVDFSKLSLKGSEPEEKKEKEKEKEKAESKPKSGPDFSGLSLKESGNGSESGAPDPKPVTTESGGGDSHEAQVGRIFFPERDESAGQQDTIRSPELEMNPGNMTPGADPSLSREEAQYGPAASENTGRSFPKFTSATFDTDHEDTLDFIARRGGDIFTSALTGTVGSIVAEGGRIEQSLAKLDDAIDPDSEEDSLLTSAFKAFQNTNPLWAALSFANEERGKMREEEGAGVRTEAKKDLEEFGKEADTTGKRIGLDVLSSAGMTAPAIATAPLGSAAITANAMGSVVYFDTVQEAFEKTESITRARVAGVLDGLVEKYTEKFALDSLFNIGKGQGMMKDVLGFLIREEGSELAAESLQMLNAKLLYEPELTMEQAVDTLIRTAISTPFSAGLQAGAMRTTQAVADAGQNALNRQLNKYLQKREEKKGPMFTPLSEDTIRAGELSEEARQRVEGLQTELSTLLEEAQAEAANMESAEERSNNLAEFGAKDRLTRPALQFTPEEVFDFMRDNAIYPVRNNERIDPASLNPGEVLISELPKLYDKAVATYRDAVTRLEERRKNKNMSQEERDSWEDHDRVLLERLKENIAKARKDERDQHSKFSRAQDLVRSWVKRYAPDMKVVLTPNVTPGTFGSTLPTESDAPKVITMNAGEANRVSGEVAANLRSGEGAVVLPGGAFSETLAHEFGHALIGHLFSKQPQAIQQAIRNDWEKFLTNYRKGTVGEVSATVQLGTAQNFQQVKDQTRSMIDLANVPNNREHLKNYIPSFEEFLAHRMARAKGADAEAQKFFRRAKGQMEKFWNTLPKDVRFDRNFEAFLEKLTKENELKRAQAEYEGRVRRYRATLDAQRRAATTPFTNVVRAGAGGVVPPTNGAHWNGRDGRSRRVNRSIDKFNWFINQTAGLTHLETMNGHIPGVTPYTQAMKAMWQDKMKWTSKAMDVAREWLSSSVLRGAEQRQRFGQFLFEADRRSETLGRRLDQDEMAELREEFAIDNEMYAMAEKVWDTFNDALAEVEESLVAELRNQLTEGNPEQLAEQLREVRRDFDALRNRNYMPHSRFGSYTVTGFAQEAMTLDDTDFKRGQQVYFGSYATEKAALKARAELEKEFGSGVRFGVGMLQDNVRELLDLPPALAQMLEKKLNLTEEQRKELGEVRAMLAPGQSFRKRFVQRENIAGYSEDAVRVFSDYMQKFAGHLSRIKYVPQLEAAIQNMKDSARGIRQQGGNSVKREKIINWYEDHLTYMLDPGNELAGLRAMGFLWYLGFNPKSALVNATQVPMVTYPYLAQEYGDVSAAAAISSAMYQVTKAQFTERGMDQDAARMIEELIERGIVDESLATELAALAEGGFLARTPGGISQKLHLDDPQNTLRVQKFFEYGALMFQAMEKMNRRVTGVATYQLARKRGDTHEVAVDKAHHAIEQTQYEYGRINRPRMMRGPVKSNVFMFWQYMTNTMWFLGQNRGAAARYMAIMFMLGGVEGIPFLGNALDMTDLFFKKTKELTGWSDPKKGAREYIWELASMLDDDPMLGGTLDSHTVMNGYSSKIFGMYDISASIQMGRMIPGTQYLSTDLDTKTEVLGALGDFAGATANIPISIIQGAYSDDPDLWKRIERSLPSMAQGVSQATRFATRGEETDSRGAQVAEFTWPDTAESWAELMGRGAGFPLTRVNQERDKRFASFDAIQYYSKRHTSLMKMLNYAFANGDDERMQEAQERIARFNKQVPYPEMQIQSQSIVQSLKEAQKKRTMREMGISEQKKYIRLQQEVEGRRGGSHEEDM